MRFVFSGPEGATFAGHDIPAVSLDEAELNTVAALQRATGLKMKEIVERANSIEVEGMMYGLFLSLHEAKHMVSWEQVTTLQMKHFETVAEPGDDLEEATAPPEGEAMEGGEDPTAAATGSVPVAAPVEAPPAPSLTIHP
jgi:hypothetical protein